MFLFFYKKAGDIFMSNSFSFSVPEEIKNNPKLASNLIDTVPLTRLTERIAENQPQLISRLEKLKSAMEEKAFNQCIERLASLKLIGNTVWLTTTSQMDRSILERNHLSHLKQAFDVKYVRIICI
jgi:hypothetical protein